MGIRRGCKNSEGWWVKALPSGEPWPWNSGLGPSFKEAGVDTLPAALTFGAKRFPGKNCMATRTLISRRKVEAEGKVFEKLELGDYVWKTYEEVVESSYNIGMALRSLGVQPLGRVAIFAETRAEWFMAAMGCLQNRITVCTLYSTLSDSGLVHALNETEVSVAFTSYDLLPRFKKLIGQCPKVKTVILMEDQLEGMGNVDLLNATVVAFSDMCKAACKTFEPVKPLPDDTAILMYTSGSTGNPKGVELSHKNIMCSAIGYSVQMNLAPGDKYIAFLPLAHIMELATEVALIALGVDIIYSSPHTLTSSSLKILEGTFGDARVAHPTVMNCVPLVLDRIIKVVTQAVEKQGWIKSLIFNEIVKYKFWLDYIPFTSYILDILIFNKVREELGGQLKRIVVGGAPLSPLTYNKIKAIFGCSVQVGYGSTETSSSSSGMNEDDSLTGQCGGPVLFVYMRLEDWKEGGYTVSDKPHPRGEVVVGGPVVAKGYFKQSRETSSAFFKENGISWFRTGDIGEIDDTGSLKIIDRKKDLVKLKHGEYVSLGNAESKLKTLDIIDNICIFADSSQDKTVTVVVPSPERLILMAKGLGLDAEGTSVEELCENDVIKGAILRDLQNHGKKYGLNHWEIPAALHLSPDPWTPDTGLVTAALKLRRKQLQLQYEALVREMYRRLELP